MTKKRSVVLWSDVRLAALLAACVLSLLRYPLKLWITRVFADSLSVHDPGKESVPSEHQGGKTTRCEGTHVLR